MPFFIRMVANAVALLLIGYLLPQLVTVDGVMAALAAAFWPGPLTLILKGGEGRLPDRLRGAEGGIGVRYTSHRGIRDLVVMGPNSPMPNAIALGSFRDPELAQRRVFHKKNLTERSEKVTVP